MIDTKNLSDKELETLRQEVLFEENKRRLAKSAIEEDELRERYLGKYYVSASHYVKVIDIKHDMIGTPELKCLVWNSDFNTNEGVFLEEDTWYPNWIETAKEITEDEWLEVVTSGIRQIVRGEDNVSPARLDR